MRHKRLGILVVLVAASVIAWLLWNRPRRVDMAAYVPADALAFVEVNDVPAIVDGIVGSDAWKILSGPAAANLNLSHRSSLITLARWTGVGSTEIVLLARSQVAVALMGFENSS